MPDKEIINTPATIGIELQTGSNDKGEVDRQLLIAALYANKGNRSKAAKQLGISRRTICRKMHEYNLMTTPTERQKKETALVTIHRKPQSLYHQDTEYFDIVEKEGSKAIQIMDLENEVILLRTHTLELLKKFRDGTATSGHDKQGNSTMATDMDQANAIVKLTQAIAAVRRTDYELVSESMIPMTAFKIWLAKLASEIKAEFPSIEDQKKFCLAAGRAGEPQRGGTQ